MPNQSPHGNLTATLVVVALLELVIDRLLGRLFLSPGCHTGWGCLLLRTGPFLLHLTGALTLVVGAGGIAGLLRRGELFPRGMRLTILVLSTIFLFLVALSLAFGRIPDRYHIHLETSFGFVVALLLLSLVGADAVSVRARVGLLLFALPPLLHVAALVCARAGWLTHGAINPERLTSTGEMVLLLACVTAPALLLPAGVPRSRLGAGVALAAGVSAFFFVAYLGRTDLVQTIVLYSVQLELPRALSAAGLFYVAALFGFVTSVAVMLLSPGPARLAGLGMCLVGLAGYQTSSPVALGLSLCGLIALATGTARQAGAPKRDAPLSEAQWRSLLQAAATALADPPAEGSERSATEVTVIEELTPEGAPSEPAPASAFASESDTGRLKVRRRGRLVEIKLRRFQTVVRELEVTVGSPDGGPPDAIIESHEAWLGRRPEERVPLSRTKTGDAAFDRRLGVHGRAQVQEPELRRRLLRLADGTITLWTGRGARFVAPGNPTEGLRRFRMPLGSMAVRPLVELTDTLLELVEAERPAGPPDAAE